MGTDTGSCTPRLYLRYLDHCWIRPAAAGPWLPSSTQQREEDRRDYIVCGGCPAEWSAWGMAEGGALVLLELPFDWLDRCRLLQATYGVAKVVGEKEREEGQCGKFITPPRPLSDAPDPAAEPQRSRAIRKSPLTTRKPLPVSPLE